MNAIHSLHTYHIYLTYLRYGIIIFTQNNCCYARDTHASHMIWAPIIEVMLSIFNSDICFVRFLCPLCNVIHPVCEEYVNLMWKHDIVELEVSSLWRLVEARISIRYIPDSAIVTRMLTCYLLFCYAMFAHYGIFPLPFPIFGFVIFALNHIPKWNHTALFIVSLII